MGIFKRKSSRSKDDDEPQSSNDNRRNNNNSSNTNRNRNRNSTNNNINGSSNAGGTTTLSKSPSSGSSSSTRNKNSRTAATLPPESPTLQHVPTLIKDLENAENTSGESTARTLRLLFALSDQSVSTDNRTKMVRIDNARLVPALLAFLCRCQRGSSEQYLVLLVLNNISIPTENKKLIALESGGARTIAKLLCEDPSCHLMAIILVNLTFADSHVRKQLSDPENDIQLVEALSYVLRISSFTHEEYEKRQILEVGDANGAYSPKDLLQALTEEDRRLGTFPNQSENEMPNVNHFATQIIDPSRQLYPETSRWCLSAIKNLSKLDKESMTGTNALIESGLIALILRFVSLGNASADHGQGSSSSSSSNNTPVPVDPFANSPSLWDSNSAQDAALYVLMNLSASPELNEHMQELGAVHVLASVADFSESEGEESPQTDLQRIKARIALAYLLGSSGHFGQPKGNGATTASTQEALDPETSVMLISKNEAEMLLQMLANAIADRPQEGPGGYAAGIFNVKWVVFTIRCLLTNTMNQMTFVNIMGSRLNTLLLKVLAEHSIGSDSKIDANTAEYAAFSLYLQSTHGFKSKFLPALYGSSDKLFAKILTSYIHKDDITAAGRHAADQLLLRSKYLAFKGIPKELLAMISESSFVEEDFYLSKKILLASESIIVEKRGVGAKPRDDIFDRPVLRSRAPKHNRAPWDNNANVRTYQNALLAAQDLSFGSTKVRHMEAIDDILIANNIGSSASGDKTESYNYWWSWQDSASQIQKNLARQRSGDSISILSTISTSGKKNDDDSGPLSFFGFTCGNLCAVDTSVPMH